jgi:hypothetical protein
MPSRGSGASEPCSIRLVGDTLHVWSEVSNPSVIWVICLNVSLTKGKSGVPIILLLLHAARYVLLGEGDMVPSLGSQAS